jgi:steroid delta-isomerase-like uncharacterized protein
MPAKESKAIARRYIEDIWNRGDLDTAQEIVASTVVFQGPIRKVEGLAAFLQYVKATRAVFPDLHFTVEDLVAEGDQVVICWTMTGTHDSAFMGIAPTGKRFAVRGVSTARLEGDTIAGIDLYWDRLGMVEQLGASLNAS